MAKTIELKLREGDPAPSFSAPTHSGETISLADLKGKHVVLYFYPKDNTPGCTVEACGFRNVWDEVVKRGAVVLGVSADSVKSHGRFATLFNLPFPLLSDEDRKIVTAYGVYAEKSFMGRKYMGIHRVTFLIDPEGKIKRIWTKVKVADHAQEVLSAID
jgi:peroxiredoxin Q/BCP